ncbi:hypothetical protein BGZ99_004192 [Dissophora globulifera]|uniref:DUF4442 domain-containing protein n=1 Tax=Dissophora globulifera TaxID=979702 RepID=A0A9P6RVS0_9FUNG|nr:hypothetical protein BGZ99_004192 [Dissophora globulifera]
MAPTELWVLCTTLLCVFVVAGHLLARKLSSLRDPLAVWYFVHGLDLLPLRMRSWLYATVIGFVNPYSRSVNFRITEIEKGRACGAMRATRGVSNPLRCVHAGALVTFGEIVGGLALFTYLGKKDRAILTNINAEYIKIARGCLTASSIVPDFTEALEDKVVTTVIIMNASFDTVSRLTLTWKVDIKRD